MAEEKDRKEKEGGGGAAPGAGGANLGLILGMFITLAVVMGGFTVFLQGGPAGEKPVEEPPPVAGGTGSAGASEEKDRIWVKVKDMPFTFNEGGKRRGRKALAKEIVFILGGERQSADEVYKVLIEHAAEGFFALRETSQEGRDFRNVVREFLMSKREEDFAAPDSERLIAEELRVHLQNHIQDLMKGTGGADPDLGTVPYCDLKVQFY